MNIISIFKFLEDKKGKRAPLKYKLLNDPKSITKDDLTVGGYLDLSYTNISSIPDNLKVGGYLNLGNTPLSRRYTEYEIYKIIKDKGGRVGMSISK